MDFIAGIDGGGTKTNICCRDLHGNEISTTQFGPFNLNSIGPEKFRELMLQSGDMSNDVGSIVYGEQAVELGLMDRVGTLHDALTSLYEMMDEQKKR